MRTNVANALAAIAAARHAGVEPGAAARALCGFTGVRRRLEHRATVAGVSIHDDFAHHPTAVEAVIDALRKSRAGRARNGRVLAVLELASSTMRRGTHRATLGPALAGADAAWVLAPERVPADGRWDAHAAEREGGTVDRTADGTTDGTADGATVRAADGTTDGTADGATVRAADGTTDGTADGRHGSRRGRHHGRHRGRRHGSAADGTTDGTADGATVRAADGTTDGTADGATVRAADGTADGATVRAADGTAEGGWDAHALEREGGAVRVRDDIDTIVRECSETAAPGDAILVMSNAGFGGIQDRLAAALRARTRTNDS